MFGTSIHPSRAQRVVAHNLGLDLVAAVGVGVSMALVTSLLPTIARRGGLEPMGLAALAAAPFIANLLGAFAGRFGPRSPRQLAVIRGVGAASLVLLFVLPVPPVMILVSVVSWLSISFGGPFHLRLWGAMYPARLRGRIVGTIGTGRAAAGALAALAGGVIADRLGGPTAVALAGAVGAVCAIAYAGFHAQAAAHPPVFSARDSIRALRERPVLARVALAQGFYGGGFIAAAPLFAIVYVDRLDLSLADVGVIGILTAASTTVSFMAWGVVSDRFGAARGDAHRDLARAGAGSSPTRWPRRSASCGSPRSPSAPRARRSTSGSPRSSASTRRSPRDRLRWPAGTRSPVPAGSWPRSS